MSWRHHGLSGVILYCSFAVSVCQIDTRHLCSLQQSLLLLPMARGACFVCVCVAGDHCADHTRIAVPVCCACGHSLLPLWHASDPAHVEQQLRGECTGGQGQLLKHGAHSTAVCSMGREQVSVSWVRGLRQPCISTSAVCVCACWRIEQQISIAGVQ